MGAIIDALVGAIEKGGGTVALRTPVERIDLDSSGTVAQGVTLEGGSTLKTNGGVVCNAPIWSLRKLLRPAARGKAAAAAADRVDEFLGVADGVEMTRSYLHLHLAIDTEGLDMEALHAHYTVMDRGLLGDDPCAEQNMIAVSNPCRLDPSLAPEGRAVLHAYCCGNEPYEAWEAEGGVYGNSPKRSDKYEALKEEATETAKKSSTLTTIFPTRRSACFVMYQRQLCRPS
mgnify:CR=1 FL=1